MSNEIRKKNTGEAGNGGEFGTHRRADAEEGLLDAAVSAANMLDNAALVAAGAETQALNDEDEAEARWAEEQAEKQKWGETGIDVGSRSPWGTVDHATDEAAGITRVSTPGHGGVKLSPARNKQVHPSLRRGSGWYEEDCEAHIVRFTFPEETRPRRAIGYSIDVTAEENLASARTGVRNWFPDGFEAATGEQILPGQSSARDRDVWRKDHADDFLGTSAESDPDDDQFVIVTAVHGQDKERFRVPADEYREGRKYTDESHGQFVVDRARHQSLGPVAAPVKVPTKKYTGINRSGLTAAGQARVDKDLSKRWRNPAGEVRTLAAVVEQGLSGKTVYIESGKRQYSLTVQEHEGGSMNTYDVTKATWDAVEAPDRRTPAAQLRDDIEVIDWQAEREYNREKKQALLTKRQQLAAERDALYAAGQR